MIGSESPQLWYVEMEYLWRARNSEAETTLSYEYKLAVLWEKQRTSEGDIAEWYLSVASSYKCFVSAQRHIFQETYCQYNVISIPEIAFLQNSNKNVL